MLEIDYFYFALLGAFSGFLAGLLGIGGGTITVPSLFFLFLYLLKIPSSKVMHLAIGTSLAAMIITSLASTFFHHKKKGVLWKELIHLIPSLIVGAILGSLIAHFLPSHLLAKVFGVFLLFLSFYLFFPKLEIERKQIDKWVLSAIGCGIGFVATILGVGGGAVSVPIFLKIGIPIKKALGTSTSLTFFTSLIGSLIYLYLGKGEVFLAHSFGYIYLPAFLLIGLVSVLFSPLGVSLAHYLPKEVLRKVFAAVLALTGIAMIFH